MNNYANVPLILELAERLDVQVLRPFSYPSLFFHLLFFYLLRLCGLAGDMLPKMTSYQTF